MGHDETEHALQAALRYLSAVEARTAPRSRDGGGSTVVCLYGAPSPTALAMDAEAHAARRGLPVARLDHVRYRRCPRARRRDRAADVAARLCRRLGRRLGRRLDLVDARALA